MSHTFESNGVRFHYDPDMGGVVVMHGATIGIIASETAAQVPAQAILDFVAEHVRRCKISEADRELDGPTSPTEREQIEKFRGRLKMLTTAELLGIDR
jgi:hypothetical protein